MKCSKCKKNIEDNSKFCQFCGEEVDDKNVDELSDKKTQELWDKFIKIYSLKGKEREKYTKLINDSSFELITRFKTNIGDAVINENKKAFEEFAFKTVEYTQNCFQFALLAGYFIWLTEKELKNEKVKKSKKVDIDDLITTWETINKEGFENYPIEATTLISLYSVQRFDMLLENEPEIKNLKTALIDKIKQVILQLTLLGYQIALAENEYRS